MGREWESHWAADSGMRTPFVSAVACRYTIQQNKKFRWGYLFLLIFYFYGASVLAQFIPVLVAPNDERDSSIPLESVRLA